MPTDIKLEKFEGPLDLLLQLIEKDELNVMEVALNEVTDQFITYLEKIEHDSSFELADFLVVATKLVYLKSRILLPYLQPEEDEGPGIADQLKMYKRYVEASKELNKIWQLGKLAYGRVEPTVRPTEFTPPPNAAISDLFGAMKKLLARLKPIDPLPRVAIDRGVSVQAATAKILSALRQFKKINFNELVSGAKSKTEVIVSFLAILELLSEAKASISQTTSYSEMEINLN